MDVDSALEEDLGLCSIVLLNPKDSTSFGVLWFGLD